MLFVSVRNCFKLNKQESPNYNHRIHFIINNIKLYIHCVSFFANNMCVCLRRMASRCFWDSDTDGCAKEVYMNVRHTDTQHHLYLIYIFSLYIYFLYIFIYIYIHIYVCVCVCMCFTGQYGVCCCCIWSVSLLIQEQTH